MLKRLLLAAILVGSASLAPRSVQADCPFAPINTTPGAGTQACVMQGPGTNGAMPISGTISTTTTFPYGSGAGQAATASSFLGIAAFNGTTVDALKDTVAAGALNVGITNATIAVTQSGSPWGMNLTNVGGTAFALGQGTMAASIGVAIASDQSAVSVKYGSGTFVVSNAGTFAVQDSTLGYVNTNQLKTTLYDTAGNATTGTTAFADAASNTQNALSMRVFGMGWNSATWDRLKTSQAIAGTNVGILATDICDLSAARCSTVVSSSDAFSPGSLVGAFSLAAAWNGTNWDRVRKDTYAAGPLTTTPGGATTVSVATGVGNTVVKNSAGRLVQFLVTTAGTASLTCYDNASTNSGTIIGISPATTAVGAILTYNNVAVNGITCAGATGSPVVTVSYY